jgi:competence protein ComEA
MNARQRGACWLFLVLLFGRALDAMDLPFERERVPSASSHVPVPEPTDEDPSLRPVAGPTSQTDRLPASPAPESAETAPSPETPLRVNDATVEELQALPGVGPVLAQRIVAFREEHGGFRDAASLRRVKGIGDHLSSHLAPLLRFD